MKLVFHPGDEIQYGGQNIMRGTKYNAGTKYKKNFSFVLQFVDPLSPTPI